jgi:hypothetical protein
MNKNQENLVVLKETFGTKFDLLVKSISDEPEPNYAIGIHLVPEKEPELFYIDMTEGHMEDRTPRTRSGCPLGFSVTDSELHEAHNGVFQMTFTSMVKVYYLKKDS